MAGPTIGATPSPVFSGARVATTAAATTQAASSAFLMFSPMDGTTVADTDNKGNGTYPIVGVSLSAAGFLYSAYLKANGVGGAGHTFTSTSAGGSTDVETFAIEIIGADLSAPVDVISSPQWKDDVHSDATPFLTNPLTTISANSLVLLITSTFSTTGGPEVLTWNNGFTAVVVENNTSNFTGGIAQLAVPTAGTVVTGSFNSSGAGTGEAFSMLVAIKPPAGGATPTIGSYFRKPFGPGKSPDPRKFFVRRNLSTFLAVTSASGSGSPTEGADAAAGTGKVTNSGSGTPTEGHDTAAGTGTILNTGSGSPTEGSDTASGSGTGSTSGSGSPTEDADIASGTGTVTASGSGSPTEDSDTAAGTGTHSGIATGSGSPTEGSDMAAGTGSVTASGSGSPTEGADTAAGTGSVATSGSGSPTEGHDVAAGTGVAASSGSGSGSPTEGHDTASGTGTHSGIATGSGAPTEGGDTAAGTGVVATSGAGSPAEGADTAAGTGTTSGIASGSGASTEGPDVPAGAGTVTASGSGSPSEGADTASGTGTAGFPGSGTGSPTEGSDTASGTGVSVPLLQPVRTPFNLGMEGTFVTSPRFMNLEARYPAISSVGMRSVSNSEGTILARFGWRSPASGTVNNKRMSDGDQVGMVLPYSTHMAAGVVGFRGRSWVFYDGFYWRIRPNLMASFMVNGNFWARFAGGSHTGQPVYASLVDGAAISGETGGAELTPWIVCSNAAPGQLAMISQSPKFGA